MRVDFGMAERWNAGRSVWASGRLSVDVAVENMRCEAWAGGQACLRRPGRITEAIVSFRGVVKVARSTIGMAVVVGDNASDIEC
jgi:hypothetical protein